MQVKSTTPRAVLEIFVSDNFRARTNKNTPVLCQELYNNFPHVVQFLTCKRTHKQLQNEFDGNVRISKQLCGIVVSNVDPISGTLQVPLLVLNRPYYSILMMLPFSSEEKILFF